MKPVETVNTNLVLKAPKGVENVIDLPVTKLEFINGTKAVESCWELSSEELEKLAKYILCVWGILIHQYYLMLSHS
jgi:hypothetical protein